MPRTDIPKLEFRDPMALRRVGPFGHLVFGANTGPDAWENPFRVSIDHGHGGILHNPLSIEQGRDLYRWLGRALAQADAETEAA